MKKLGTILVTLFASTLLLGVFLPIINKRTDGKVEEQFDKWLAGNQEKPGETPAPKKSLYEKRHADDYVYTLDVDQAMKEGFYTFYDMYNISSNSRQIEYLGFNSQLRIGCKSLDTQDGVSILDYITGSASTRIADITVDISDNLLVINSLKERNNTGTLFFQLGDSSGESNYISFEMMYHLENNNVTYSTDEVFRASVTNQKNGNEKVPLFIAKKEDLNGKIGKQVRFNSSFCIADYGDRYSDAEISIDVQKGQYVSFDYIRFSISRYPFKEVDFNSYMQRLNHGEVNQYNVEFAWIDQEKDSFYYDTESIPHIVLDESSTLTIAFRDPMNKIILEEIKVVNSGIIEQEFSAKKKRANNWTYYQLNCDGLMDVYFYSQNYNLGTEYVKSMNIEDDVMIYSSAIIPSDAHFAKLNPVQVQEV